MMKALLFLLLATGLISMAATPQKVTTTFPMIADWANQMLEKPGDIKALLTAGMNAHAVELRPSQISALKSSDHVLILGTGIDEWVIRGIAESKIVRLFENKPIMITPIADVSYADFHQHLSPSRWEAAMDKLAIEMKSFGLPLKKDQPAGLKNLWMGRWKNIKSASSFCKEDFFVVSNHGSIFPMIAEMPRGKIWGAVQSPGAMEPRPKKMQQLEKLQTSHVLAVAETGHHDYGLQKMANRKKWKLWPMDAVDLSLSDLDRLEQVVKDLCPH